MKKLLIFSVIAIGFAMSSCTEDGLHTDPAIPTTIADDTGGGGTVPTKPPPPCGNCQG